MLPRRFFAVPVAIALAISGGSAPAIAEGTQTQAAQPWSWQRDKKDPRWVLGRVTVDAAPDDVFARIERVDQWPQLLSDVNRMKVTDHKDAHWKIDLETKTLPYGMLGYDVQIGSGRSGRLYTDRLGVRVVALTEVAPGPTAQQSVITYSFYITLSGIPSLMMSEAELQKKQEHMVEVTLSDFYRAFHTK